jgi:rod shape-determining protein MreC
MESVLGRYRNLIILVGVLFLQVLGLATQVKRGPDAEHTRLIRIWVVGAITPFERGLVWMQNGTGNLWHNYIFLRGVRAENRQLKDQIEHMRIEQVRLNEDAAQAHRLQSLLAFKEQFIAKTVAAQVIGSSGSDLSRSIYIDKGSDNGIQQDMAVITADGIVGKVLRVYPSTSLVLLIDDQSSGVGAILEKTRLQGVLRGTPTGEVVLERVMSDEQVPPGETVLTSGGDQIFPKGLPIGTVSKVGTGKDLFLNIKVKPAADLSKLEEVLVLVEKQERQAVVEDTGRVRAVDILAQRLPSVPEKPAGVSTSGVVPASNAAAGATTSTTTGMSTGVPPKLTTAATPAAGTAAKPGASTDVKKSASPANEGTQTAPAATSKPVPPKTSPGNAAATGSPVGSKPVSTKPVSTNPSKPKPVASPPSASQPAGDSPN